MIGDGLSAASDFVGDQHEFVYNDVPLNTGGQDHLKQIAGRLALRYVAEMDDRVRTIVAERERLSTAMRSMPIVVTPSGANFILFRPIGRPGRDVWQGLLDRSVLVRDCSGWPRLPDRLRVTVGTGDENDAFLNALKEVVA